MFSQEKNSKNTMRVNDPNVLNMLAKALIDRRTKMEEEDKDENDEDWN